MTPCMLVSCCLLDDLCCDQYPIVDRWPLLEHDLLGGGQESEFRARPRSDVDAYVAYRG